ncbi:MAG: Fimbrial assembly family protein [Frankiales bacterium]|nr:Fimbrial assembly family protein [Frankiales bacterium]
MTVLSTETRLIGSGTALLPRVNLLPPEIAEKRAFRRIQMGLGAALVAAVGIVGMLYVSATHSVSAANTDLASAKSDNNRLQTQAASYRDVTATYAAAAAAQAQLTMAMGDEVRYSQLLNDLALSIPSTVWLKNIGFAPAAAAAATPGTTSGSAAVPTISTFTVSGVGFSQDDVALWLDSLASQKANGKPDGYTYSNVYFSNSTEALLGSRKTVNFTSTANLTGNALSGRYTKPAGG